MLCSIALFAATLRVDPADPPRTFHERISALEGTHGGRLGVAALDTATNNSLEYRSTERFAMCSTIKLILVATVLAHVDEKRESLERRLSYGAADLLNYAPITKAHLHEGGLNIETLSAAAIEYSDNTAANLLLNAVGGPEAVTAYVRSLGDPVTRLDRNEPSLNSNLANDIRDTTSPAAMMETMKKILSGQVLSPASCRRLEKYLLANTTGSKRLRAAVPSTWRVGDKTGTGENGATNDIAVIWPPQRPPIFVAAYFSESTIPLSKREAVLAEVGKLIVAEFSKSSR
jgi:beta-lactamase class A